MESFSLHEKFKFNMKEMLGDEYDRFFEALTQEPQKAIRINSLKTENLSLFPFLKDKVVWADGYYCDNDFKPGNTWQSIAGLIYSQDASAMSPVEALGVQPGDKVLDLCAAPGGKSTQIAQKLKGKGILVANEIVPQRSRILYENIERLGISNAVVLNENPKNLEKRFEGYFDKILVDAPCSGEGMFRKDSDAREMWTEDTNEICANRQMQILKSAVKMLKSGGILVYSTCTFSKIENEELIADFVSEHPEFELIPHNVAGVSEGFAPAELSGRIFPHRQNGEGHYFAKLVKNDGKGGRTAIMKPTDKPDMFREFEKKFLDGISFKNVYTSGENVYVSNEDLPDLTGLSWLCGGIFAGKNKKGRFEPEHHLALALKKENFRASVELSEEQFRKYISGETINADVSGWCVMCFNGFPVGLGKGSGGTVKNHYPKGLRRLIK